MPTPSNHRLRLGLPGYLILFAPHAFVPQRQLQSRQLPSQSGFWMLSMHFTATASIPPPSSVLKLTSFQGSSVVEQRAFTPDLMSRLRTL